jgi:hypothetical protein
MGGRTRFLVLRLGKEQDLFSVRESGDGSLVLLFKATQSTFGGESFKNVSDLHTTIHSERAHGPSKRSSHKVNYTLKTEDRDVYSGSVIVERHKRRGFLWPVTNTLTALSYNSDGIRRVKKDSYVELVGYTFPTEILCYTIYGHSKDVVPPRIQGFNHSSHEFSHLNLTVYGTFLHLPNYPVALVTSPENLPVRKNGAFLHYQRELFAPTMSVNGIERYLQRMHARIADQYLNFLATTPDRQRVAQLRDQPVHGFFSRWPSENDEIHTEYGVWSRHKNQIYSAPNFVDGRPKPRGFVDQLGIIRTIMNTPEALAGHGLRSRYEQRETE